VILFFWSGTVSPLL
jgi:hypothetical protein